MFKFQIKFRIKNKPGQISQAQICNQKFFSQSAAQDRINQLKNLFPDTRYYIEPIKS